MINIELELVGDVNLDQALCTLAARSPLAAALTGPGRGG